MRADIKAGRAFVELYLKNTLAKGLQQARKQLDQFGQSAINVGRKLATLGVSAAVPFAMATKTFMDFDDAMRAVQGVTSASIDQFEMLTAKAKQLGASTSFTATQVASLMVELGRAGFVPDEIEKMTGAVLNLSRATGTDATMSAGIMAATIRQFGLAAGDAARVSDSLTAAANKSFNTVESLGEALSYAGPVAADFNMSLEDTLAILGALGNVGIQGSNAGTAVRRLLTLGAAEAEKLKGIFGVAFTDAAGNARPLVDVLDEVNQATANMGTAERAKKFNEAFGLLGITGASAISKNAVSVRELQKAIKEAGGIADATAKKMDGGLGGAFRIMMSAIEGVAISIGESLAPMLTEYANIIEKVAQATITYVEKNKEWVQTAAKAVIGTFALGGALIAAGVAAKVLAFSLGLVSSPFVLIGAGLAAGVAAWAMWSESGQSAIGSISKIFNETWGGITDALAAGDLSLAGEVAFQGLIVGWETALDTLGNMWRAWSDGVVKTITAAMRSVLDVWRSATSSIANWMARDVAQMEQGRANAMNRQLLEGAARRIERGESALAKVRGGGTLSDAEAKEFGGSSAESINAFLDDQRKQIASITGDKNGVMNIGRGAIDGTLDAIQKPIENFFDTMDEVATAAPRSTAALDEARAKLAALRQQASQASEEAKQKASEEAKQKASGAVDAAAAGVPGALASAASGGSSSGSFSGAALIGIGRGTRDPVVEEIRKGREIDKKMLKADEAMLEHFARGGLAIIGP